MCRLLVHGKRGAVALSILLLFIPKLLCVFLFRHIVKITVIAHYPTAIAPEVYLSHSRLVFSFHF